MHHSSMLTSSLSCFALDCLMCSSSSHNVTRSFSFASFNCLVAESTVSRNTKWGLVVSHSMVLEEHPETCPCLICCNIRILRLIADARISSKLDKMGIRCVSHTCSWACTPPHRVRTQTTFDPVFKYMYTYVGRYMDIPTYEIRSLNTSCIDVHRRAMVSYHIHPS